MVALKTQGIPSQPWQGNTSWFTLLSWVSPSMLSRAHKLLMYWRSLPPLYLRARVHSRRLAARALRVFTLQGTIWFSRTPRCGVIRHGFRISGNGSPSCGRLGRPVVRNPFIKQNSFKNSSNPLQRPAQTMFSILRNIHPNMHPNSIPQSTYPTRWPPPRWYLNIYPILCF